MNPCFADLILFNGNVITMEKEAPRTSSIAVKGNKILFVGSNDEVDRFKNETTQVIDLKGKTVIPGLIESHMHPLVYARTLLGAQCGGENTKSLYALLKEVARVAEQTPEGEWIHGWGWDDSKIEERRNPTRWDLDKVAPNHPVALRRGCGHIVAVNSLALKICNINANTKDPQGGHIEKDPVSGEPTGILQENAQELLPKASYTPEDYKRGMLLAQEEFFKRGITTVADMSAQDTGLRVYQQMLKNNDLMVRMRLWPFAVTATEFDGMLDELASLGIESCYGNDMLNIQGVKFLLDGSMAGKTAAVNEPYYNDPSTRGILYYSEEELTAEVVKAFRANLRVSIHAIGERAIEQALNAIEKAEKETGFVGMRNRIEHCSIPTKDQIDRIKKLNIMVGSSIGFIYFIGGAYFYNLGPERVKAAFPQKTYLKKGIIAPGNSDCPVCDVNPFLGIHGAVTRTSMSGHTIGIEESISPLEALRAYTINAAYSMYDDKIIGSIKADKYADIAVLDQDPTAVNPKVLKDIKVLMTVVNGKIVYNKFDQKK